MYQNAVQVGDADHVAHCLDALDEFPEVGHHVFTFDDLGVPWESGRQQPLVDEGLEAHHDGMVCGRHGEKHVSPSARYEQRIQVRPFIVLEL